MIFQYGGKMTKNKVSMEGIIKVIHNLSLAKYPLTRTCHLSNPWLMSPISLEIVSWIKLLILSQARQNMIQVDRSKNLTAL